MGGGATEDALAYFRDANEFRNYTMLELPHHGPLAARRGRSRLRHHHRAQFSVQRLMLLLWDALAGSTDAQLAAIAAKSVKEARYHLRHARDWLVRLGDGTEESHARTQAARGPPDALHAGILDRSQAEAAAVAAGIAADPRSCAGMGRRRRRSAGRSDAALAPPAASCRAARGPALRAHGLPAGGDAEPGRAASRRARGEHAHRAAAWAVLDAVPDPEIPVVSIRDLGILREVNRATARWRS